jgi:hypothetical protein
MIQATIFLLLVTTLVTKMVVDVQKSKRNKRLMNDVTDDE